MKNVRTTLYLIATASAIFAGYLSFEIERINTDSSYENHGAAAAIDSAKDGGAAGFAILSGLALVATSITYLSKE